MYTQQRSTWRSSAFLYVDQVSMFRGRLLHQLLVCCLRTLHTRLIIFLSTLDLYVSCAKYMKSRYSARAKSRNSHGYARISTDIYSRSRGYFRQGRPSCCQDWSSINNADGSEFRSAFLAFTPMKSYTTAYNSCRSFVSRNYARPSLSARFALANPPRLSISGCAPWRSPFAPNTACRFYTTEPPNSDEQSRTPTDAMLRWMLR